MTTYFYLLRRIVGTEELGHVRNGGHIQQDPAPSSTHPLLPAALKINVKDPCHQSTQILDDPSSTEVGYAFEARR